MKKFQCRVTQRNRNRKKNKVCDDVPQSFNAALRSEIGIICLWLFPENQ